MVRTGCGGGVAVERGLEKAVWDGKRGGGVRCSLLPSFSIHGQWYSIHGQWSHRQGVPQRELMKNPSTPQRFWLPLLYDSLKLLNWQDCSLLSVSETNLLLNKLHELSLAKLRPHYTEPSLPPDALSSIRLALATNLGQAILDE